MVFFRKVLRIQQGSRAAATRAAATRAACKQVLHCMHPQVRRYKLEEWLGEPFFARAMVGALVRVAIKQAYILAEVLDIVQREPGSYRRARACPLLAPLSHTRTLQASIPVVCPAACTGW